MPSESKQFVIALSKAGIDVVFAMGMDIEVSFNDNCPLKGISITEYENYYEMSPIDNNGDIDYNNAIGFTSPCHFTDRAKLLNEVIILASLSMGV